MSASTALHLRFNKMALVPNDDDCNPEIVTLTISDGTGGEVTLFLTPHQARDIALELYHGAKRCDAFNARTSVVVEPQANVIPF